MADALDFRCFVRLIELRPRFAVSSAYLFGLTAYTTQFYWIHTALHDVSGLPDLYAVPLTLPLLPPTLPFIRHCVLRLWKKFTLPRSIKIGLVLPILWTLTEFARERFLTGFGWGRNRLLPNLAPDSPLAKLCPVGSIHMVTLATAFLGVWLVWQ